ncbi:unnamed protein product, partial [Sphacelaria rigidula]
KRRNPILPDRVLDPRLPEAEPETEPPFTVSTTTTHSFSPFNPLCTMYGPIFILPSPTFNACCHRWQPFFLRSTCLSAISSLHACSRLYVPFLCPLPAFFLP